MWLRTVYRYFEQYDNRQNSCEPFDYEQNVCITIITHWVWLEYCWFAFVLIDKYWHSLILSCYRDLDPKKEKLDSKLDDLGWKAKLKIPPKDHRIQTSVSILSYFFLFGTVDTFAFSGLNKTPRVVIYRFRLSLFKL